MSVYVIWAPFAISLLWMVSRTLVAVISLKKCRVEDVPKVVRRLKIGGWNRR